MVAKVGKPKFCCKVEKLIAREKSYEIEYIIWKFFQILLTLATVCQIASHIYQIAKIVFLDYTCYKT